MNIAWIEDDQGSMETGAKILVQLLDEKNETNLMDKFDNPNNDVNPEWLEKFFEEHTLCRLSWFQTYPSMRDALDRHCCQKWDVVIIDLNLVSGFGDEGKINPEKAGFALYIQLLRLGFSSEYIAFYTGNKREVELLSEDAEKMGIPPPKSFDKANAEDLKKWLNAHLENKELILRRGILDGCKYLSSMIHEQGISLRINECAIDEDRKIEGEALTNWLSIWPKLLPELTGSLVATQYSPFILILLSLWDKKAKNITQKNTTMAQSPLAQIDKSDKDRGFAVIPYLLTHARNWSAHGHALHDASPEVVSFIFLLAGRGLIKRQAVPDRHEKILLSLFTKQGVDIKENDLKKKRNGLYNYVKNLAVSVLSKIDKSNKHNTKKIDALEKCRDKKVPFNELVNCYVNHSTDYAIENPSKLLMWSLLIDLSYISTNGGEWKLEKWKGDNDWLEQLCFSLSAYLLPPEETVQ